ncbi:MAG TPA: grasp-with-spasm system ATP-grasp peptide maturase [Longimicrobium sp.]|nr:grasp-with-spasm system ATP-grasp peptide maturase [Longimicrobium sp.]
MIALLSQAPGEASTSLVMDWLHHLGAPHVRLNGDELNEGLPFAAGLEGPEVSLELGFEDGPVRGEDVRSVWFRRWHVYANLQYLKDTESPELGATLFRWMSGEMQALSGVMEVAMSDAGWLTRGHQMSAHKFSVLRHAARAGLEVPATLVTNSRRHLEEFRRRHGRVVCKPLREADSFRVGEHSYSTFTAEVTDEVVATLPETFFPTLLQEAVEKRYELRVFCLKGRLWPMAIFSQRDEQTRADFRHYNQVRPNRQVPYTLPGEVAERCRALMERLGLDTGSLDLIRAADGRYVFLEVNPVGQFGMTSEPCNYRLERHVAEYLMEMDAR